MWDKMRVLDTCSISTFVFILADTHTNFVLTSKQDRLIDKDINETCNDFKGHGNQCHVYWRGAWKGSLIPRQAPPHTL